MTRSAMLTKPNIARIMSDGTPAKAASGSVATHGMAAPTPTSAVKRMTGQTRIARI